MKSTGGINPNQVLIFGAGGASRQVIGLLLHWNTSDVAGIMTDSHGEGSDLQTHQNVARYHTMTKLQFEDEHQTEAPAVFVALGPRGLSKAREAVADRLISLGWDLATLISPSATIIGEVGQNCFFGDYSFVGPGSTIGDHTQLMEFSSVAPDSHVGNSCYLGSKSTIGSLSFVGSNSFLGLGAIVSTKITVEPETVIGAGVVLTRHSARGEVFMADLAKSVSNRSDLLDL